MNFSSVRIVLVATSHPGNIGSAARAMKTMGLDRLYLVEPKLFPDLRAYEMAAGADDVLEECTVVASLHEAIQDCQLVIATTARQRGLSLPELLPQACAELVGKQTDDTQVAIVFGRERTGLTNDELLQCHYQVNIPANPEYSSLNLSQAVQIIAYELRMNQLSTSVTLACQQKTLATVDEVEQFYEHLSDVLLAIRFLKPENPGKVQQRIRRLFSRVRLEDMEVSMLRGMLSQMQKFLK